MSKVETSLNLANLQFNEITSSIRIWNSYKNILLKHSTAIFGVIYDAPSKAELTAALKERSVGSDTFHRSLFIQIYSIFEFYIKSVTEEIIDVICTGKTKYSSLTTNFRDTHLVLSAKVLSHLKSGSVNGIAHNFSATTTNLGNCLLDVMPLKLNKEVFTLLMGNCTPDRIDVLFRNLDLPSPFDEKTSSVGKNSKLQNFFGSGKSADNVKEASKRLKSMIEKRNDMVHGNITSTVSLTELLQALDFTSALAESVNEHICQNI